MEEGFVRFMRRFYYWVFIALALLATLFGVFYPPVALVFVAIIIILAVFFAYYHYKYELLKQERRPVKKAPKPVLKVEDVDAGSSKMPDMDDIKRKASEAPRQVRANIIEGSGMDLVERYVPLGEMLFPIAFIADRAAEMYQEGSLEVGAPICLWHGVPVWFSPATEEGDAKFMYHCPKCPKGGKPVTKSQDDTKKAVELISLSTLRDGKMPIRDESLLDAMKRGRGELPG